MVLAFSESLGLVWGVPACFLLPTPPAQFRAMVWVIEPLYWGTEFYVFRVRFFFVLPTPPPIGVGGALGDFATPTVAQDYVMFFLFGGIV